MNVGPAYKHYALFTFLCTRCIFPIEYFSAWSKTVTMIFINYRCQRVRPCDQSCDFPAFHLLAFMPTILQVRVAGQCALYRSEGFARLVLHTIGWKSQPRTVRHFCANGLVRPRFNSWLWSKKKTEKKNRSRMFFCSVPTDLQTEFPKHPSYESNFASRI